jgi:hypothetical protein
MAPPPSSAERLSGRAVGRPAGWSPETDQLALTHPYSVASRARTADYQQQAGPGRTSSNNPTVGSVDPAATTAMRQAPRGILWRIRIIAFITLQVTVRPASRPVRRPGSVPRCVPAGLTRCLKRVDNQERSWASGAAP